MTQNIIIQVGQCGNQIGHRFWHLALKEHISNRKKRNVNTSSSNAFFDGSSSGSLKDLRARAVLIDMEEGVVAGTMRSRLGFLFDHHQLITDVSGSANNWAVGFHEYGSRHDDAISDVINRAVEKCDSLQSFFVIHSMGGGTGSGLGSYVLRHLEDNYPDVFRFVVPVFPSDDDDVITSPYNCLLAMQELKKHSDCVFPMENQALSSMVRRIEDREPPAKYQKRMFSSLSSPALSSSSSKPALSSSSSKPAMSSFSSSASSRLKGGSRVKDDDAFDSMNDIAASLLLNLTCSSRYNGTLNVDLNEITTNLVPYPDLKFLIAGQSPLHLLHHSNTPPAPRKINALFSEAFCGDNQMIKSELKSGVFLSCGVILRGDVPVSDVRANIDRLKASLKFVDWNQDGWKIGLCSYNSDTFSSPRLLLLSNNSCIRHNLQGIRDRFVKLYSRKAHAHHYTRVAGMEASDFDCSLHSIEHLIQSYQHVEQTTLHPSRARIPRIKILS